MNKQCQVLGVLDTHKGQILPLLATEERQLGTGWPWAGALSRCTTVPGGGGPQMSSTPPGLPHLQPQGLGPGPTGPADKNLGCWADLCPGSSRDSRERGPGRERAPRARQKPPFLSQRGRDHPLRKSAADPTVLARSGGEGRGRRGTSSWLSSPFPSTLPPSLPSVLRSQPHRVTLDQLQSVITDIREPTCTHRRLLSPQPTSSFPPFLPPPPPSTGALGPPLQAPAVSEL